MAHSKLTISGKELLVHKAVGDPDFGAKSVLVTDTWDYVTMWMKRSHKKEALFYWDQARHFYDASLSLSNTSSPLTSYYCFLNAVKALLSVKALPITAHHGVSGKTTNNKAALSNEEVYFLPRGVLSGLCAYLGEPTNRQQHSLKDLLYNLPYIHRAYHLTFPSQSELFIPIADPCFVKKADSTEAWFCAEISDKKYQNQHTVNKLSTKFEQDVGVTNAFIIRRKDRFRWRLGKTNKTSNLNRLRTYHAVIRKHVVYIHAPSRLWYIKRDNNVPHIVDRSSLAMTFAAMHRLSELARYNPLLLSKHFDSQHNWLLSEFIATAAHQFIDEISSEITGHEFLVPGRKGGS